jgi:hypothetical protein
MIPQEIFVVGIPALAVVVAMVQIFKHYGLDTKWAPLVSIGVGLVITIGNHLMKVYPAAEELYIAIWSGILLGMAASGFYDVANKLGEP